MKKGVFEMYIINQDHNVIFTLKDKGLFPGTIYTKDIYRHNRYMGTNIYGRRFLKKYLLGTYEDGEGEMVINEIFIMLKAGERYYKMPAPSLDLEDMEMML